MKNKNSKILSYKTKGVEKAYINQKRELWALSPTTRKMELIGKVIFKK